MLRGLRRLSGGVGRAGARRPERVLDRRPPERGGRLFRRRHVRYVLGIFPGGVDDPFAVRKLPTTLRLRLCDPKRDLRVRRALRLRDVQPLHGLLGRLHHAELLPMSGQRGVRCPSSVDVLLGLRPSRSVRDPGPRRASCFVRPIYVSRKLRRMAGSGRRKVLRSMIHPRATRATVVGVLLFAAACGGNAAPGTPNVAPEGGSYGMADANGDVETHSDASADVGVKTHSDASLDVTTMADAPSSPIPQCGPSNCLGCCMQDICFPGIDPLECGSGGQACQACADGGKTCEGQQCVAPCSASTCSGCCAGNQCLPGTAPAACGEHGALCADCTSVGAACVSPEAGPGGACTAPAATCNPRSCPLGCCNASGACVDGISVSNCGVGGAVCQTCSPGSICVNQMCTPSPCTPQTCPTGCCDSTGSCQSGEANAVCGTGGSACADCTSTAGTCSTSQECLSPGQDGGACNCPLGCCDAHNQCHPGASNTQCGTNGTSCLDCTASATQCSYGQCEQPLDAAVCNEQTCPTGCCDGYGLCQQGITNTTCGNFGTACQDCFSYGFLCSNQQCATPDGGRACGEYSCMMGCCDALGNCQPGNTTQACGNVGEACVDCATAGDVCTGGECVSPDGGVLCSQSCSGCCDDHGECHPGFTDTQCGGSGGACQDCTALSPPSTCDLNVNVVACANQQSQCPGPYSTCPVALTQIAPVRHPGACSTDDLVSAGAACSGGAHTSACIDFFTVEYNGQNPDCYFCLGPFEYDFAEQAGIHLCAQPYVDQACNHNGACLADCIAQSCSACADWPSTEECDAQAQSGSCATYTTADQCAADALAGPAAVCNPATYQNDFGAWLQAVGAKYCGP